MVMVLDRHRTDLYVRPSWFDAAIALHQIDKHKARGDRTSLQWRKLLQKHLFDLGCFLHHHAGKVLFVAIFLLAACCVGLKSAILQTKVDELWIEDGGRLEQELNYIESVLGEIPSNTHQLVIQTTKDSSDSLLHPEALLTHLEIIKAASSVTIQLNNEVWRLKDLCYSPSFSKFEVNLADQIFNEIIPCSIITPLDCFWEGSKLLGSEMGVAIPDQPSRLKWTSLNPQRMLKYVEESSLSAGFPMKTLEDIMRRAGITSGYQEKPCLNPKDKECPDTAPNKNSTRKIDVGAHLTGGCYGFASKYMHWPERMIIGAATKNKTGHITKAKGLQTVIQLMTEKEIYEYYADDVKTQHIIWTPQKAAHVLESWQRKFSQEVKRRMKLLGEESANYNMYSFSTATLNEILSQFSKINLKQIVISYLIMLIFVGVVSFKFNDPIMSQTMVSIAGVILVSITNAAALGMCAIFGVPFNASSTQILPYLGLGVGVINLFLLTSAYARDPPTNTRLHEQIGVVLQKGGLGLLLTSFSDCVAFAAAVIVPIPALRVFSIQAAFLVIFNLVTTLLVFPAIISLDLRRRRSGKMDILCCCCVMPVNGRWPCIKDFSGSEKPKKTKTTIGVESQEKHHPVTSLTPPDSPVPRHNSYSMRSLLVKDVDKISISDTNAKRSWTYDHVLDEYARFLCRRSIKTITVILFVLVMITSVWNISKVVDGLDLSDIVPLHSDEHGFLVAQRNYFGFYDMYAITQSDFEYPTNQKLLYEYHEAFTRIPNIVKNDNGGLSQFWLGYFRDWLIGVQKIYDRGLERGCFTHEGWCKNASDEEILGYKLTVQTGDVENPVDKFLFNQTRLVDVEGLINAATFYNYLSAWVCHDTLAYSVSQANLQPEPRSWCHVTNDKELKIPKSSPLVYAQIPFYLQGLSETADITALISQVRAICEKFEQRGLPNFPTGIPFVFWEQYHGLKMYLSIAVVSALMAIFAVVSLSLLNIHTAIIIVLGVFLMIVQLVGIFGLIGIKLNAIPAVLLIVAVGINVHFVVHTSFSFLTTVGDRERRLQLAIQHMFPVIVHGAVTILLAVVMLAFNDFDFIIKHFLYILTALVAIGCMNGLLFVPVLLLILGPPPELKPLRYQDRICTPSPEPVRKSRRSSALSSSSSFKHRQHSSQPMKYQRNASLSTITEEPTSGHSTAYDIVVEPELVLESAITAQPSHQNKSKMGHHDGGDSDTSYDSSPSSVRKARVTPSCSSVTATPGQVTVTAEITLKVQTPFHNSCDHGHRHSSRRRDSTCSTSTTSTECSMKLNS